MKLRKYGEMRQLAIFGEDTVPDRREEGGRTGRCPGPCRLLKKAGENF